MNKRSLTVGFSIGFASSLIISFAAVYFENNSRTVFLNCNEIECADLYLSGFVHSISNNSVSIVKSFEETTYEDQSMGTIINIHGDDSNMFWCKKNPLQCERITYNNIPIGTNVCAHASLNSNGSFTVSRFFFNSVCIWASPPDSEGND